MKLHKFWFMNPCIIQGFNSRVELIPFYKFFVCKFFNSACECVIAISLSITKLKEQLSLLFFNTKIGQDGYNAITCRFKGCTPTVYVFMSWVMRLFKCLSTTKSFVQQIYNFRAYLLEDYAWGMLRRFCLCVWNTQYSSVSVDTKRPITIQASCKVNYQIIVHSLNYNTLSLF